MRVVALLGLVVVLLCGCDGNDLRLSATPPSGTIDLPVSIRGTGFDAGERVVITASGRSQDGALWRGRWTVAADASGEVVLRDRYVLARLRSPHGIGPWPSRITLTATGQNGSASTTVRRGGAAADALLREDVRPGATGIFGEWIRPRGTSRHTAVLVLGGSDGGLSSYTEAIASTLAGDGYPVLALAYFGEPGLPQALARIPLEYFRRALSLMRDQPAVDPNRIVTFGVSRGAELSLILASTYPKWVRAAIGYVPTQYVVNGYPDQSQPAWTYRGQPYLGDRYEIPVEQIRGPLFVVGAADDQVWPSARGVHAIKARMRAHGRTDVTGLVYRGAGHSLGWAVPIQVGAAANYTPGFGGSPAADERAREDSWPKLLRFLARL